MPNPTGVENLTSSDFEVKKPKILPVTNNSNITLGGKGSVANDRRDVSYSARIERMRIAVCDCGRKLRGKEELCRECR